jgi:hypothetical protein
MQKELRLSGLSQAGITDALRLARNIEGIIIDIDDPGKLIGHILPEESVVRTYLDTDAVKAEAIKEFPRFALKIGKNFKFWDLPYLWVEYEDFDVKAAHAEFKLDEKMSAEVLENSKITTLWGSWKEIAKDVKMLHKKLPTKVCYEVPEFNRDKLLAINLKDYHKNNLNKKVLSFLCMDIEALCIDKCKYCVFNKKATTKRFIDENF